MTEARLGGRRKPSIYDVAELAGVSHQTVSRVLNDHPNIRPATRQRVLDAIQAVNYTRNPIARALATNRSMQLGVLVDSPIHHGPNSTLHAIEGAARAAGYSVSATTVAEGPGLGLGQSLDHLLSKGVEGLCVIAPRLSSMKLLPELTTGLPTVVIKAETDAGEEHLITAALDQRAGATAALDHLYGLGHRRIAHVAGPLDWLDARVRERTWREYLAAAGLPPTAPIVGDWTSDTGYRIGLSSEVLLESTAVFAGNDQMALGLVHGLHERGIRVPEDLSVVGFDDLPDAGHFLPPLTTVRQDFEALGRLALAMLLAALEGGEPPLEHTVAPTLVVRSSTAPPRA
jgi:DNA-binding LacI/PurR family transcriptional regulator